jgi:hypothetical protein
MAVSILTLFSSFLACTFALWANSLETISIMPPGPAS